MIVGLMMTKNEADVIVPVLETWHAWRIPIVAMDGSSDGTWDLLRRYPNVRPFRDSDLCGGEPIHDWAYQRLLDKKRELFGSDGYCCLALGDELWQHDPRKIVAEMENQRATFAKAHSMQFFLDRDLMGDYDFDQRQWKKPMHPIQRLRRYSWGHLEDRIFEDRGQSYSPGQKFDVLPQGARERELILPEPSRYFLIRHYPMRDPVQIDARAKDRFERGYQPFYEESYGLPLESHFRDRFPRTDNAVEFDGSFGDFESSTSKLR